MADQDRAQSAGRKANDAQPPIPAKDEGGPERYPSVRHDDAVEAEESRSFAPNPSSPADQPSNAGKVGPDGKPAGDNSR